MDDFENESADTSAESPSIEASTPESPEAAPTSEPSEVSATPYSPPAVSPSQFAVTPEPIAPEQPTAPKDYKINAPDFSVSPTYEAWDYKNKKAIEIPESQLPEALVSGNYALQKGTKLPVINPAGESGTIDGGEAALAFKNGFQIESASKQKEDAEKQYYSDKTGQAFLAALGSTLSFGGLEQLLTKAKITDPEYLKKLEQFNPISSGLGTTTGIVAPALASGGESLLAKGISGAGSAVEGLSAAGKATEKFAAKALEDAVEQSGKKSLAKKIVEKSLPYAMGSAVEGTGYGLGQLVHENALGDTPITAENILAYGGTGAIIGGGLGGLLGAGEALVPIAKAHLQNYKSAISEFADPMKAGMELIGVPEGKALKLEKLSPGFKEDSLEILREPGILSDHPSAGDIADRLSTYKEKVGTEIGDTMKKLDDITKLNPEMAINKQEYLYQQGLKTKEVLDQLEKHPEIFSSEIKTLRKLDDSYTNELNKTSSKELIKPTEIWEKRKALDSKINWSKKVLEMPQIQQAYSILRNNANDMLYKLADKAEATLDKSVIGDLPSKLRDNNKKYSILTKITDFAEKKAANTKLLSQSDLALALGGYIAGSQNDHKAGGALGLGLLAGKKFLASDLRRRIIILANMERANQSLNRKITSSALKFFKGTGEVAPASGTKFLMKSNLAKNMDSNKKPKSEQEAFTNLSKNISYYSLNPDKLVDTASRNTMFLQTVAPKAQQKAINNLINGVKFLNQKMPKKASKLGMNTLIEKPFVPSTLDLSKFDRYLKAVEDPVSVMTDLSNGNLTNEGVETLKAVYPNIYSQMQDELAKNIEKHASSMDYNKKIQLGMMMDTPVDESMIPQNIARLQGTFIQSDQSARQSQNSPQGTTQLPTTAGGVQKIDVASNMQSDNQAFLERRS